MVYLDWISLPSYLDPAVLGTIASLVTIVLVSRSGQVSREEAEYRMRLHETPQGDRDLHKTLLTLVAPALLVLYGLSMPFAVLNFYVIPYQRGSGELLPGGGINWSGAEAWFAFGPALLFVPLGLVSVLVIWKRYRPLGN
jgi:sodium/pantothenate symporter